MTTPEKETLTPKTVEEVVAHATLTIINTDLMDTDVLTWEQLVEDTIRQTLLAQNQAADERLRAVLEEIADEIPEAYGWGEEDEEADRGFRICSKNVKAMIRKRAAKHGITNL